MPGTGEQEVRGQRRVETRFLARASDPTMSWLLVSGRGRLGGRLTRRRRGRFDGRAGVPPAAGARVPVGESTRVGARADG